MPSLDMQLHTALGPRPANERGADHRIRLFKQGSKWVALLTTETSQGPVSISASADEKTVAALLAHAMELKGSLVGATETPAELAAFCAAARRLAQDTAKANVLSKVGALPEAEKNSAAKSLYTRLTQKDHRAWLAVQTIITRAKAGDAKARDAWTRILAVHARAQTVLPNEITQARLQAASRLYDRLQRNDQTAWEALHKLAEGADAGHPDCLRGWRLIARVHDQRVRGVSVGGVPMPGAMVRASATRRALPRSKVSALVLAARAARASTPRALLSR